MSVDRERRGALAAEAEPRFDEKERRAEREERRYDERRPVSRKGPRDGEDRDQGQDRSTDHGVGQHAQPEMRQKKRVARGPTSDVLSNERARRRRPPAIPPI